MAESNSTLEHISSLKLTLDDINNFLGELGQVSSVARLGADKAEATKENPKCLPGDLFRLRDTFLIIISKIVEVQCCIESEMERLLEHIEDIEETIKPGG